MSFISKARARPFMVGALALAFTALAPNSADAQSFNFSTDGYFTSGYAGCNGTAVCQSPIGDLALTFTGVGVSPLNFTSGTTVLLGSFSPSGTGSYTLGGTDLLFTLVINQTLPTVGSGQTAGYITGSIVRDGDAFSDLVWRPSEVVNIDQVTYDLIFRDLANTGIVIAAQGGTTVEAIASVSSTVPEPASMIMLGTGLIGLVGVAHRRRRNSEVA